jgi:hypothetical protein
MNKFTLPQTLLAILISSTIFAQNEPDSTQYKEIEQLEISTGNDGLKLDIHSIDSITGEVKDTTKIMMRNSTIYIVNETNFDPDSMDCGDEWEDYDQKSALTHWAGLDIGINGFLHPDDDLDLGEDLDYLEIDYAQSRSLNINFWEHKIRIVKDYVGITTGAGIQWNNYRLKNDYTLVSTKDTLVAFMDSTLNVKKNKLRTTYVQVPLLLEFNTSIKQEKSFHLSAGFVAGLHLGSMYKQKYTLDGVKTKSKSKGNFNVAPFKLDAMTRVGYGAFNIYASVQLNELFDEGDGPEIYPFTLGVTIAAFD